MTADQRVLVLAPTGRDGTLATMAVRHAGIVARECTNVFELASELALGAGVLVVAEEALPHEAITFLADILRRQEPWSDLPIIVVTTAGETVEDSAAMFEPLGNVTLIERPVRKRSLLSAVKTALRARQRQYEVRDHLEERQRIEAARERLLTAEQAARAEVEAAARAKDEFLAILSHELRTPLQSMLGWLKVLADDRASATTRRRGLDAIERGTRAQTQLIEDLLDISRIIAGKMRVDLRPVDVESTVAAAVDAVASAKSDRRVYIDTIVRAKALQVAGDPNRLQQIVWNLVSNAVKFTRENGRVEVAITRVGGDAVISVRDDGIGIAPEVLPRIFERFQQADSSLARRHGGLGLGLAIVRHLVELHGGAVTAHSAGLGFGTTFTVRIPVLTANAATDAPGHARPRARAPLSEKVLAGLRLLLVDDDADSLELLATFLDQAGASVTIARSAGEALAAMDKSSMDVIVSDISMPGQDGYSLLRTVRERARRYGQVPAMALTAHARPEDTEQALLAGFDAHVAKPIDPVQLRQMIAKLAGRNAA